jgi:hypothetical protein
LDGHRKRVPQNLGHFVHKLFVEVLGVEEVDTADNLEDVNVVGEPQGSKKEGNWHVSG